MARSATLKSVPRRPEGAQPDRCWKVVLAKRGSERPAESLLAIASDVKEAMEVALGHCGAPDLEVTAVERLPSGVITRNTAAPRAAQEGR